MRKIASVAFAIGHHTVGGWRSAASVIGLLAIRDHKVETYAYLRQLGQKGAPNTTYCAIHGQTELFTALLSPDR